MQVNEEYKINLDVPDYGTSEPSYGAVPPKNMTKIYESPDGGKTVYERNFGADPSIRTIIKTSVQQQWNITFNGEKVNV